MPGRILIALALAILIYSLAIGTLNWLLFLAYSQMLRREPENLAIGVLALIASLIVGWAILPRRHQAEPSGLLISPSTQPALFEEIQRVSRDIENPAPDEVYLTLDADASVYYRGGFLGMGTRRIMEIGLGLFAILTVSQLRAELAHEYGHFRFSEFN